MRLDVKHVLFGSYVKFDQWRTDKMVFLCGVTEQDAVQISGAASACSSKLTMKPKLRSSLPKQSSKLLRKWQATEDSSCSRSSDDLIQKLSSGK